MSWKIDRSVIGTGPRGEIANTTMIEHSARFERGLRLVTDGVWCYVGAGLSNITFVEAPEGLIVIDSGDCREEAAEALAAMREHSAAPLKAMLWSHYHYVQGTAVYVDDAGGELEIWSHVDGPRLLAAVGADVGPVRRRGIVSQFAIVLPGEGPDALPNAGLGPFWKDPDRPRTTPGYVAPNRAIDGPTELVIAGERVVATPIPSDSEDTLVLWFPDRTTCVNNHLWPALFNIFAMRGEIYRDPIGLLDAFDLMMSYAPDHLVGVHGPPISGAATVHTALVDYRDSIQFLWDQTVRGMNAGLTLGQLVETVQLPARFADAYYTTELYGMAQHHVRQIHAGVRGWFDGDAVNLFPLAEADEAARIVAGFGGHDVVLDQARAALADDEAAWAVQLATYLLRLDPDDPDARAVKAGGLRLIARTVPSANARSWCTTQALELEGALSLDRFRVHHTSAQPVLTAAPEVYVHALKVQLEPARADFEFGVQWRFSDSGATPSLRIRRGVAVPGTADPAADAALSLDLATWAGLYAGTLTAGEAEAAGTLTVSGDRAGLGRFFAAFDQPHLAVAFG
ncbi:MAG TPA: alkyl sulfatase dimerization domain-containing protein [Ilumatobacter sp.]